MTDQNSNGGVGAQGAAVPEYDYATIRVPVMKGGGVSSLFVMLNGSTLFGPAVVVGETPEHVVQGMLNLFPPLRTAVGRFFHYGVQPSNIWMSVWARNLELHNEVGSTLLPVGTDIVFKSKKTDVVCGYGQIVGVRGQSDTILRLCAVYVDDSYDPNITGLGGGDDDEIIILVNGHQPAAPMAGPLKFAGFGERVELRDLKLIIE